MDKNNFFGVISWSNGYMKLFVCWKLSISFSLIVKNYRIDKYRKKSLKKKIKRINETFLDFENLY